MAKNDELEKYDNSNGRWWSVTDLSILLDISRLELAKRIKDTSLRTKEFRIHSSRAICLWEEDIPKIMDMFPAKFPPCEEKCFANLYGRCSILVSTDPKKKCTFKKDKREEKQ